MALKGALRMTEQKSLLTIDILNGQNRLTFEAGFAEALDEGLAFEDGLLATLEGGLLAAVFDTGLALRIGFDSTVSLA